jgi:hypothetical protein
MSNTQPICNGFEGLLKLRRRGAGVLVCPCPFGLLVSLINAHDIRPFADRKRGPIALVGAVFKPVIKPALAMGRNTFKAFGYLGR